MDILSPEWEGCWVTLINSPHIPHQKNSFPVEVRVFSDNSKTLVRKVKEIILTHLLEALKQKIEYYTFFAREEINIPPIELKIVALDSEGKRWMSDKAEEVFSEFQKKCVSKLWSALKSLMEEEF